ncbi:hypothetical protein BC833DRAFT_247993 [Globomyces pollinis-pini]|nr:hypothetical protein BC833DRAFT_247993 [Globomyces pollinis-pini]
MIHTCKKIENGMNVGITQKKPPNSFFLYKKDMKDVIMKTLPTGDHRKMATIAAEWWRNEPDHVKNRYRLKSKQIHIDTYGGEKCRKRRVKRKSFESNNSISFQSHTDLVDLFKVNLNLESIENGTTNPMYFYDSPQSDLQTDFICSETSFNLPTDLSTLTDPLPTTNLNTFEFSQPILSLPSTSTTFCKPLLKISVPKEKTPSLLNSATHNFLNSMITQSFQSGFTPTSATFRESMFFRK